MRYRVAALALVSGLALGALVLAGDAATDLRRMEGTWRPAALVLDGKPVPKKDLQKYKLIVKTNGSTLVTPEKTYRGTYKLYPDRTPRGMDVLLTDAPDRGKKKLAIYEFRGETLRFCVAPFGSTDRPQAFASKPGSGIMLETWERVRE